MKPAWPPLIPSSRAPWWMRVRDLTVTIAAWVLLGWFLRDAVLLAADWLADPIFELTTRPAPDWPRIWRELQPLAVVSALLAAWLLAWAMTRRRTLGQSYDPRQPEPVEAAREAAATGLSAEEVARWRALRVATVHFDESGRPVRADGRS